MSAPPFLSAEDCQRRALKVAISLMQAHMTDAELAGFRRIFQGGIEAMTRVQLTSCHELCRRSLEARRAKEAAPNG